MTARLTSEDIDWLVARHVQEGLMLVPRCRSGVIYLCESLEPPTEQAAADLVTDLLRLARIGLQLEAATAKSLRDKGSAGK
jgi:hypothetical protein